jgi:hypothetical protein
MRELNGDFSVKNTMKNTFLLTAAVAALVAGTSLALVVSVHFSDAI